MITLKYCLLLNKAWKNGFNSSWLKYYHMHLTTTMLIAVGAAIAYRFWDIKEDDIVRDRIGKYPGLQYIFKLI